MNRTRWIRLGLAILAVNELVVGAWALVWPRSFFDSFPAARGWVALLPPFNEHLVRDVGGLSLAFGVLFAAAILHPYRPLVRAAAWAWLTAATPHLVFHLTHPEGLTSVDALGQSTGLTLVFVIPIILLFLAGRADSEREQDAHVQRRAGAGGGHQPAVHQGGKAQS